MRRAFRNISFEAPPSWEDKTMVAFAAPNAGDGLGSSVTVMLDTAPDFFGYVMKELSRLASRGLRFQDQTEWLFRGRGAVTLRMVVKTDRGMLVQATSFVDLAKSTEQTQIAIVTATCPAKEEKAMAETFHRVLESLRVDSTAAPTRGA